MNNQPAVYILADKSGQHRVQLVRNRTDIYGENSDELQPELLREVFGNCRALGSAGSARDEAHALAEQKLPEGERWVQTIDCRDVDLSNR